MRNGGVRRQRHVHAQQIIEPARRIPPFGTPQWSHNDSRQYVDLQRGLCAAVEPVWPLDRSQERDSISRDLPGSSVKRDRGRSNLDDSLDVWASGAN